MIELIIGILFVVAVCYLVVFRKKEDKDYPLDVENHMPAPYKVETPLENPSVVVATVDIAPAVVVASTVTTVAEPAAKVRKPRAAKAVVVAVKPVAKKAAPKKVAAKGVVVKSKKG